MRCLGIIAVAVLAVLASGCLVDIQQVTDAGPAFAEALRDAGRLQGQEGSPETLNILVFDPDESELVRVEIPIWLVEKLEGDIEIDEELDSDERERLRRHLDRDLRLEDLAEAGLGVLLEVTEEDGEHVLIWLS